MERVMADCRRFESDNSCSVTIMGTHEEVVPLAIQHAVTAHGHEDTPELRRQTEEMLEPASAYTTEREAQPFPSGA
jgi:Protein of unknown function (DUF1059)